MPCRPVSFRLVLSLIFGLLVGISSAVAEDKKKEDPNVAEWSSTVKFPAGETPVPLFNGKDFTGWEGNSGEGGTEKYFTIKDGVIIARNEKDNAPKVSNYLLTKKSYRNFRLIVEGKLVESGMHSGIAIWGKKFETDGQKFSYQGHLVMFPTHWGFWDLYRRNRMIHEDKEGLAKKADNAGGWNRMEILALGDRIRLAVNGQLVADWREPDPKLIGESAPIGLQLHSNNVPQEIQFRGLILSENPKDEMATVKK